MATGLQVWAPDGTLLIDTTTSVVLILGTFALGGGGFPQSGSVVDERLRNGRPYAFMLVSGVPAADGSDVVITTTANSIDWSFPVGDLRPACVVMYGTY